MENPTSNNLRYKQQTLTNSVLPEIPQKNLTLINSKLDLLVNLFEQNKNDDIYYDPEGFTRRFFYLYLIQKYNNQCYINVEIPSLHAYVIDDIDIHATNNTYSNINKLYLDAYSISLFECIKNTNKQTKVFVIPLGLRGLGEIGHSNLLIYRKESNQLEHFEPHGIELDLAIEGRTLGEQVNLTDKITYIVNKINELNRTEHIFDDDLIYIEPMMSCPNLFKDTKGLGFQGIQNIEINSPKNIPGSCVLWSILIGTLILENPEVSTTNIQECILKYAFIKGHMTSTEINVILIKIIVGFLIYMVNTMDDYVKLLFMGSEFDYIGTSLKNLHHIMNPRINIPEITTTIMKRSQQMVSKKITNPYDIKSTGENIRELKEEIENNIRNIDSELSSLNTTLQGLKNEMEPLKESFQTYRRPTTLSGSLLKKLGLSSASQKSKEYKKYKSLQETYDELELKRIALNFGKERLTFMINTIEEVPSETSMKEAATQAINVEPVSITISEPVQVTEIKSKNHLMEPLNSDEMAELEQYLSSRPNERRLFELYSKTPLQKRKFYNEIKFNLLRGGITRKGVTKRKRISKKKRAIKRTRVTKKN